MNVRPFASSAGCAAAWACCAGDCCCSGCCCGAACRGTGRPGAERGTNMPLSPGGVVDDYFELVDVSQGFPPRSGAASRFVPFAKLAAVSDVLPSVTNLPPPPPRPPQTYDFGRPFAFVFEDPEWVQKILLGGVFMLASVVIVGVFFVYGYAARLVRNVIDGVQHPLPAW